MFNSISLSFSLLFFNVTRCVRLAPFYNRPTVFSSAIENESDLSIPIFCIAF